ncbi:SGNH/GDSL hydrolase family protein [Paenibacillus sp. MBLB4367]|uniref:SGNH/GDSL hydrolase family protein n=1 Tax=Paenibacillus sp. MBLB4367 TaxID=3384767 RepID=UPI00390817F7
MREKKLQWLMAVSVISCLAWVGGLAWTLQHYWSDPAPMEKATAAAASPAPEPVPAPEAEDGSFRILALGDSLTRGTGDPDGKGYVGYALDRLKEKEKQEIVVDNFGVNGQTSPQLAELLQKNEVQAKVKAADVILVSIGGNDLFRGGQTLADLDAAKIKEIEDAYMSKLHAILKQLRSGNESAKILLIGLYNPFIDLKDTAAATTKIVRDWNYKASEAAAQYPLTVAVPTFDLFQLKIQDYLARDLFHPNAAGYRLIGDRVAALITG